MWRGQAFEEGAPQEEAAPLRVGQAGHGLAGRIGHGGRGRAAAPSEEGRHHDNPGDRRAGDAPPLPCVQEPVFLLAALMSLRADAAAAL